MQTKIIGGGVVQPGVEIAVDPTYGALRFAPRPLDYANLGQVLGHYAVAGVTGALAGVASAGAIFSFRWTDASRFAILQEVKVSGVITTVFTAAQVNDIDMVIQRGFTASDTGGTALTPTGNSQKMRTTMGSSLVGDVRIATTGALGAGTKTPDAQPVWNGQYVQGNTALASGVVDDTIYISNIGGVGEHPILFAQNEGFNIRAVTAMGAAGVVKIWVAVRWVEVAVF